MQALDKRIAMLEQANIAAQQLSAIIISPLGCTELNHIHDSSGNQWTRLAGETQQAFKDRAAPKPGVGKQRIALLVGR